MRPTIPVFLALAILGALAVIPHHLVRGEFGYFHWQNGEFLNYALFASYRAGVPLPEYVIPFIAKHAEIRTGVDYINAAVSKAAGVPAVHTVDIAAALLRGVYLAVLFTFAFFVGEKYRVNHWLTAIVCAAFALYPLDIWHFQISFMSANLALAGGVAMIGLVYAADRLPMWAVIVAMPVLNVGFLLTYPEAFVLFKGACVVAAVLRKAWKPVLIAEAVSVVVAPLLYWQKLAAILSQASSGGGWNILGEPLKMPLEYLAIIFGLRFRFTDAWFPYMHYLAVVALLLAVSLYMVAARKEPALWLVPAGVVAFHLLGLRTGTYYPAAKFITWTAWTIVPVAIIALARVRFAPVIVGAALSVWLVVDARAFVDHEKQAKFFSHSAALKVADEIRAAGSPRVVINGPDGLYAPIYWFEFLTASGFQVAPKDERQARNFGRADYFWKLEVNAKPHLLQPGERVFVIDAAK